MRKLPKSKLFLAVGMVFCALILGGIAAKITEYTVSSPAYPQPAAFCFQSMPPQQCATAETVLRHTRAYGWPNRAVTRTDNTIPAQDHLNFSEHYDFFAIPVSYSIINWLIFSGIFLLAGTVVLFIRLSSHNRGDI